MKNFAYSDGSHKENDDMYIFGWIEYDDGKSMVTGKSVNGCPKPHSSHYAEYLGVYAFLTSHIDEKWELRIDSNIVYNQINGIWNVRSKGLKHIYKETNWLFKNSDITFKLIKSKNNVADNLLRH